jgi:hypothetical protein
LQSDVEAAARLRVAVFIINLDGQAHSSAPLYASVQELEKEEA